MFISNSVLSFRCFRYNRFWGGQNHLVYIGDSRVRQLYSAAVAWVEQEAGRRVPTRVVWAGLLLLIPLPTPPHLQPGPK